MSGFSIDRRSLLGTGLGASLAAGLGTGASAANPAPLAPGRTKADFAGAMKAFRGLVGAEWVFGDEEAVAPWSKTYIPDPAHQYKPVGAVCPQSVEEVQEIVRIANTFKQPLWTVSTGKNMGYGMTAPATPGQVVLDLKRMNRILEVDADLGTCLLEPGVTYQQLKDYLEEHKIPLWIDVPTVGPIASPVGNTLDRGVGYTPYGEHFMFQCGMEVCLPDGRLMRTGMGSIKGSTAWQAFKWGYGPYLDGLFTQSNFGIVTKMGLWLMPKPPVYKPFMVRHANMEDVPKIIEAMRPLRVSNLVANCNLMMSASYQLAMFKRRNEIVPDGAPLDEASLKKAASANGLGMWNTYFALYGTEQTVAGVEPIIRATLTASGGEVLTAAEMEGNPWFHHHQTLMQGGLNLDEVGLLRWRGAGGGLAWFAPVAAARGVEAERQTVLAKKIVEKHGFDYTAAYAIGWRDLHHIIALLFDKADPAQEQKADACYRELVTRFGAQGWASYRTGVNSMDLVAQQYGEVNRDFNRTLKRAIDPNGILSPGKSGIHP
ncbi:FAD-binding oxidoreductase [Novosphingobium sp. NBM11]|uniref:FAD-binding oxidoreductase n=1 Tax=Novosphingobium sp. NBM11 TaxID=2596914 RepID=UPI0018927C00|nr:FAD-binding oxidoreductase [Novosphingobium sp. NBM11]MBF5089909.1 FAD-binding oxidoreductase [Novosphingobium sp. NBM11]